MVKHKPHSLPPSEKREQQKTRKNHHEKIKLPDKYGVPWCLRASSEK